MLQQNFLGGGHLVLAGRQKGAERHLAFCLVTEKFFGIEVHSRKWRKLSEVQQVTLSSVASRYHGELKPLQKRSYSLIVLPEFAESCTLTSYRSKYEAGGRETPVRPGLISSGIRFEVVN